MAIRSQSYYIRAVARRPCGYRDMLGQINHYTVYTMHQINIAGIGELLWDMLPDSENLGGAPVNFTYHCTALGTYGIPISTVGRDRKGEKALRFLAGRGVTTSCISMSETYPTGYVEARLDRHGVASYHFPDEVAWDHLTLNNQAQAQLKSLHAISFGTLGQRSPAARRTIESVLGQVPKSCLKVFDLNLRQNFYTTEMIESALRLSEIFKLNELELEQMARLFTLPESPDRQVRRLLEIFELDLIILTRGPAGSLLSTPTATIEHPGIAMEPVNTIGAGDSFNAATIVGLLMRRNLQQISDKANELAAYVCSQPGAMPDIPAKYRY